MGTGPDYGHDCLCRFPDGIWPAADVWGRSNMSPDWRRFPPLYLNLTSVWRKPLLEPMLSRITYASQNHQRTKNTNLMEAITWFSAFQDHLCITESSANKEHQFDGSHYLVQCFPGSLMHHRIISEQRTSIWWKPLLEPVLSRITYASLNHQRTKNIGLKEAITWASAFQDHLCITESSANKEHRFEGSHYLSQCFPGSLMHHWIISE